MLWCEQGNRFFDEESFAVLSEKRGGTVALAVRKPPVAAAKPAGRVGSRTVSLNATHMGAEVPQSIAKGSHDTVRSAGKGMALQVGPATE